ncbi:GNAT family N-acetyltransferase [Kitasatospora sp. NPDC127121]|uniref:GNAT family N-acetyltransferase n=1 Tax=Kitasatospora sp. NPDC127121 TaxID=3345371 RepID=UPI0036440FBD
MPIAELRLNRHTPDATVRALDDMVDLYTHVYNVPPYIGDPFFSVDAFRDRLLGATELNGFECLTVHSGETVVGLVHGVTLPAERTWWTSLGDQRPEAMVTAAKAEGVAWLRELMVRPDYGNQGIGRRLHDEWIAERRQRWTALTCIPDNEPAHGAYRRWGYEIIGRIKHADDSPVYDAMVLPATGGPVPEGGSPRQRP